MRIAEFSESSNLWTHIAPFGIPKGMPVRASLSTIKPGLLLDPMRLEYVAGPKNNDGVMFDPRCNELLIARIEVVGRPGLKPIIF